MCLRYHVINISDQVPLLKYWYSRVWIRDLRDTMSDSWISLSHEGSRIWSRVGGSSDKVSL